MSNKTVSDRAKRAGSELSPEELKFANLWLDRANSGMNNAQCVLEAYPGHTDYKGASVTASRILRRTRVLNYLGAMGANALEAVGESFESSVEYWKERASTAEELIGPYCEKIEFDDGEKVKPVWFVSRTDIIPRRLVQYVDYYSRYDSGFIVHLKELHGPKERATARQQLDKLVGNSIERVELSGVVGTVEAKLPTDASISDVAQVYQRLMGKQGN